MLNTRGFRYVNDVAIIMDNNEKLRNGLECKFAGETGDDYCYDYSTEHVSTFYGYAGIDKMVARAVVLGQEEAHVRAVITSATRKPYMYQEVEDLLKAVATRHQADELATNIPGYPIPTTVEDLSRDLRCKCCMINQSNIFLKQCGHIVCCSECAQRLTSCPVCRVPITGKQLAFF